MRDLMEALDRARKGTLAELQPRLPERLRSSFDIDVLRTSGPTDTLPLPEAEELLLSIDRSLGDGTGQILEDAAFELGSRIFSQSAGVVVAGDLAGTVARMHAPLERPFVGAEVVYELVRSETGFTLSVGVPGHPRSTRVLRHLVAGIIRAAQRFCRESQADELHISAASLGDRATLEATYRRIQAPPSSGGASAVRFQRTASSRGMRAATQPSLSDEVERILAGQAPELTPDSMRKGRSTANFPAARESDGQTRRSATSSSAPPAVNPTAGSRTTSPRQTGPASVRPRPITNPDPSGQRAESSNPPASGRGFQGRMPSWAGGASISQPPDKPSPFAFPKSTSKPPPDDESKG